LARRRHTRWLVGLRESLTRPGPRLLVALLMNDLHRDEILRAVAAVYAEGNPEQLVASWISDVLTATHGVMLNNELQALISERLGDDTTELTPPQGDKSARELFALLGRTGLFTSLFEKSTGSRVA